MGWKHYHVGSGLFGIRLLILHLKFQSNLSNLQHFIFPIDLTYPLRKKKFLSKNAHMNIYTKPPNSG